MHPFDHVRLGDVEFILWYRPTTRFPGPPGRQWYALDVHMNKVGVYESDLVELPPRCERHGQPLQSPVFFRETWSDGVCTRHEIVDKSMMAAVGAGKTAGRFAAEGLQWSWNTRTLDLHHGSARWLLRVMTPGGTWL